MQIFLFVEIEDRYLKCILFTFYYSQLIQLMQRILMSLFGSDKKDIIQLFPKHSWVRNSF